MAEKRFITMEEVQVEAVRVVNEHYLTRNTFPVPRIWGVPRGGVASAFAVAMACGGVVVNMPSLASLIVDDIYDSGSTRQRYREKCPHIPFVSLFDKREKRWHGQWLVMPWEVGEQGNDDSATDAVVRLLQLIGEDPTREGLRETPARVVKAWGEWASGYGVDPATVLKSFEDGADKVDEMVIVHNIPIVSKCEHHLADICGTAHVGYIPNGRIVGLSKLPRLVDIYARRLQVQERLTNQIANALTGEPLNAKGVGVIIRAEHRCISSRGVKIHGSTTTTSAMRGVLLEKPEARAEFIQLCVAAEQCRQM